MSAVSLLAHAFSFVTWPDARRLSRALHAPLRAEERLLAHLTRDLMTTRYGRSLGVDDDPRRFFKHVPIVTYREMEALVQEQMATGEVVVSPGDVALYERTSGSSGTRKYIPYSPLLRRTFARMFRSWAHDLVAHGPRLHTARFYFSISPSFDDESATLSGAEVGIASDANYLDGFMRRALEPFFVAPAHLARERDPNRFKDESAVALLLSPLLEIVSVWSPTFFLVLLDHIVVHHVRLIALIEQMQREAPRRRRAQRLDALRIHFADHGAMASGALFHALWPHVKVISCWRAGNARAPAEKLAALFPRALVQGKGLLATEAPVSIPLVAEPGDACAPLVDDVLIEVLGPSGDARRLSSCSDGDEGEIIVSPRGGFMRYRLGDRVRVTRAPDGSPRITMLGRADRISDLVGEKLEEGFVERTLAALFPHATLRTLVPVLTPDMTPPAHYVLFVDDEGFDDEMLDDDDDTVREVAHRLDRALSVAFHYAHARALGQLALPSIIMGKSAADRLLRAWSESGRRAGDLKPCALVTVPLSVDDDAVSVGRPTRAP
jgi:hypothetical protein